MTDTNDTPQVVEDERSLKDLRTELVAAGMPADDTELILNKSVAKAVLSTLKAKGAVEEVKRVATLVDPETPAEKRAFEKTYLTKAQIMKNKLMSQPKVWMQIPLEKGEKQGVVRWEKDKDGSGYQVHVSGAIETPQINGFKYMIPKGVQYEVPMDIAKVYNKSVEQTANAGRDHLISEDNANLN